MKLKFRILMCAGWLSVMGWAMPWLGASGFEPPSRARVFVTHDPAATSTFVPSPRRIAAMVDQGLTGLLGKPTPREAWLSLISTQDTVGIKVFTGPGPTIGTRPAVVEAVVTSLLSTGIPANQIVIWDRNMSDLQGAGMLTLADRHGVRVTGSADSGYDPDTYYETTLLGRLVWGDLEFGRDTPGAGRRSHASRLISRELTRIISISPLLNHNAAGVSGHLYGLTMGGVDNTLRFEGHAARLSEAVPELMAELFADKFVLGIVDALICQYQGEARPLLHYSTVLNQLWFGTDPVALDVLAIEELERQRQAARIPGIKPTLELYDNAALLELGVSRPAAIDVIRPAAKQVPGLDPMSLRTRHGTAREVGTFPERVNPGA
jgi:hypothetical protein